MGISFSATNRRRSLTPHYPPPAYPLDHYAAPYPVNSPVSYPYYQPNAFCAGNHTNALVGQPSFGAFNSQHLPFEWQPMLPMPRVAGPTCTEQTQAKVVRSDVNVHKDSVRLEADETNPDQFLVSFVFDALVDGSITIYYFAKEESNDRLVSSFPETYVPIKIMFQKGLHQEFRQPLGTGINFGFFLWDGLSKPLSREDVFPIVISVETCPPPYDRTYLLENTLYQVQITQVVLDKNHDGKLTAKVVRQLLWTDGISYELREIYGFGKSTPGFSDSGSGKECVICMTEPKDIAVLPCRHMIRQIAEIVNIVYA
ncbi:RING/U-box superfamily protein isoform 1 [Dorcoceras hygrometricum]|uniref:RING-type E3 ubiquitin transferase n=1 Tax=Dorcoceras hygrometricum TaxID=472368 RepID=A0A2Z7D5Z8_9LAMI|nr:RING/U-box superfamily protein isoform 1 [Dorcoceras hygrometricum]